MNIETFADFKVFIIQFIKFGIVGVSNTLVGLGVYYIFIWFNPALYQAGNVTGWILGVLNSVYWNRKMVFKDSDEKFIKILGKSYLAYGGSFLLTVVLLHILVELIGISPVIAPLLCLLVTIPINFLANKFWTFRSKKTRGRSPCLSDIQSEEENKDI